MLKLLRKTLKRSLRILITTLSPYSLPRRLGYKWNTKLLIIHADDMGLSGSENAASIEALDKGMVNSGSIMVPCSGFDEIADYSKKNTQLDLGIHLTISSEWKSYKWHPVLPLNEVSSLVDSEGYLLDSKKKVSQNANADEAEKEFRAQIDLALKAGIKLTHIDSHMFSAFANNAIIEKFISLGKEYKLPVLLSYDMLNKYRKKRKLIIVDSLYYAEPKDYNKSLNEYYSSILNSMKPGLNCILIHVAYDNSEMGQLTDNQINYGSAWRQSDFDYFTGEECRKLIEKNNIQLITWREIREKLILPEK